jgi:hypothetical protein
MLGKKYLASAVLAHELVHVDQIMQRPIAKKTEAMWYYAGRESSGELEAYFYDYWFHLGLDNAGLLREEHKEDIDPDLTLYATYWAQQQGLPLTPAMQQLLREDQLKQTVEPSA